jgi:phosphate starvation-inducible PhoH-like protein
VVVEENGVVAALLGERDENLRLIERLLPVQVSARGQEIRVRGEADQVERVRALLEALAEAVRGGHKLTRADFRYAVEMAREGEEITPQLVWRQAILESVHGRPVVPKTVGQSRYVEAIREHDLTFCVGPAGTGKTYLAVALAVAEFRAKRYGRIVLARPAVEAGEKLGFLPGDLREKVDPYLRPVYDALMDFLPWERYQRLSEQGVIEVAPLAYMRGRTMNNAFVILDEGQNTTHEQMKMFLTRLGFDSKAVVTGDITQIDLPRTVRSGMIEAQEVLQNLEGMALVALTERDVVRHPLVKEIVRAYERYEARERKGGTAGEGERG